jgi:hypothetical protein
MSKGDTTESNILKLIFQAVAWANIADNASSGPLTNLWVALHTADPGETGNQSTSEIAYTGYARTTVARATTGWAVTGTSPTTASNVNPINFPQCTGGAITTATYFSVGVAFSGATVLLYSGALSSSLAVSTNITPSFTTAACVISED